MKTPITLLLLLCATAAAAGPSPFTALRPWEQRILLRAALDYRLDAEQRKLLCVVRLVENGVPGYELGADPKQARRWAGHPEMSLYCQACWISGTIKKRYTGDLRAYAERHCPLDAETWYKNAEWWMRR